MRYSAEGARAGALRTRVALAEVTATGPGWQARLPAMAAMASAMATTMGAVTAARRSA